MSGSGPSSVTLSPMPAPAGPRGVRSSAWCRSEGKGPGEGAWGGNYSSRPALPAGAGPAGSRAPRLPASAAQAPGPPRARRAQPFPSCWSRARAQRSATVGLAPRPLWGRPAPRPAGTEGVRAAGGGGALSCAAGGAGPRRLSSPGPGGRLPLDAASPESGRRPGVPARCSAAPRGQRVVASPGAGQGCPPLGLGAPGNLSHSGEPGP